jgi:EAL domain-containing protein (putative c-di-GMP-specific phosphodiesterase class I)
LSEVVAEAISEAGIKPGDLLLELTEGAAMQDLEFTQSALRELREMGVRIAIDDFGTGHSSLSYLRSFPVNVVKIDRTFVKDLTNNPDDAAIANTIIVLAQNLKLGVIAEGVETEEQLARLREWGCDEAQGFLFSKPVPPEEVRGALNGRAAPTAKAGPAAPTRG